MDSPIASSNPRPIANQNLSESYSSNKESFSSNTTVKADGSTVSKIEYSSEKTSYVVSFNSSSSFQQTSSYTYSQTGYMKQPFNSEAIQTEQTGKYQQLSSKTDVGESEPSDSKPSSTLESSQNTSKTLSSSSVGENNALLDGASNILKFIEQRIASEKADGASEEELATLWEQGLIGFDKGFDEAKQILSASGQLEGDVEDAIYELYSQVKAGFNDIYNQYINPSDEPVVKVDTTNNNASEKVLPSASDTKPSDIINSKTSGSRQFFSSNALNNQGDFGLSDQFKAIGNGNQSGLSELISSLDVSVYDAEVEYGRKDSFDFELTTLEGDVISIKASNTGIYVGDYSLNDQNGEQVVEGMKDKNQFEMDIVGDLNESETAAIEDLLGQIMSLADEFYNGDIDKAYEAALDLGYNQEEIASYSVNLRQTEQFSVAAAYTDIAPDASVKGEAQEPLSKIGDFAQSVLESLNKPENYQFFDYTQLLRGISEQIDNQIKPTSKEGLLEAIDQLVNTQEATTLPELKQSAS